MPCYSSVETKLASLDEVEEAARKLGYRVERHGEFSMTVIDKSGIEVEMWQSGDRVSARLFNRAQTNMVSDLTDKYAETRLKRLAEKRGFKVAPSAKKGQFVLVKYG